MDRLFVVTHWREEFEESCRRHDINPHDNRKAIWVNSVERSMGIRPNKDDLVVVRPDAWDMSEADRKIITANLGIHT